MEKALILFPLAEVNFGRALKPKPERGEIYLGEATSVIISCCQLPPNCLGKPQVSRIVSTSFAQLGEISYYFYLYIADAL